jgi:hypothetical protein
MPYAHNFASANLQAELAAFAAAELAAEATALDAVVLFTLLQAPTMAWPTVCAPWSGSPSRWRGPW